MKKIFLSAALAAGILFAFPASSMSLFISCDGGSDEPQPRWVSEPDYSEAGYVVGVGASAKSDKSDRMAEAEANAKRELVGHIEVTVKSENSLSTSVSNRKVQQDGLSKVTVISDEKLRGLKTKARWLDKETCTQYILVAISNKDVELAKREKTMKALLEKFKAALATGKDRNSNPDVNERRKYLEDAQELLAGLDFKPLTDAGEGKAFYQKQLDEALASLNDEASRSKDHMALFALNKDHRLNDAVIGKMLDQLRATNQSADHVLANCNTEDDCIKVAKERGFAKVTMLNASCQVGVSQMGSLKGKLTVTKTIYDITRLKWQEGSPTASAEVIGWSNEELDWSAAAEKVMQGLK